MKKLACMLFAAFLTSTASADVHCVGKINAVYKWNTMTSLSIQIIMADGTVTPWINMPTKSDEAMALLALSSRLLDAASTDPDEWLHEHHEALLRRLAEE